MMSLHDNALMKLIPDVISRFVLAGKLVSATPYGNGHINDTFLVTMSHGGTVVRYILQRINTRIFTHPDLLMENIMRVTEAARQSLQACDDRSRRALSVIPGRDGLPYVNDDDGGYWRVYVFVERTCSFDEVKTPEQAYQAARAFGGFQRMVANMGGDPLHETIPAFHDTPARLEALERAIKQDICGRVTDCTPEIEFVRSRQEAAGSLVKLLRSGYLPARVTHNDTKINNVLFDAESGEGICVIDLDTVMPGLVHYDFGDMVRTATSTAAEDETDLSKVHVQMDLFEALLSGYLSAADGFLTPLEKELLPFSGKLITLEIGVRFLTDYLQNDTYFKTHYPQHNLDRCRNQFQRVRSIERQFDKMQKLVTK
jgi:hypothetical protein